MIPEMCGGCVRRGITVSKGLRAVVINTAESKFQRVVIEFENAATERQGGNKVLRLIIIKLHESDKSTRKQV